MWLLTTARWIEKSMAVIGRMVSWLALGIVLVGITVVILRYGFSISRAWMQELTIYMHAALFLIGAACALQTNGHVRVGIFYDRFSARLRTWIDLITMVAIVIPFCILIHWTSMDYVLNSWQMLEGSRSAQGLHIVYILKTYIWVFADLLALAALARTMHCVAELRGFRLSDSADTSSDAKTSISVNTDA